MPIIAIILQLLSIIAPMVAKIVAAVNESQQGGLKQYDKLAAIALDQVKAAAAADWPGDTEGEKNTRKFLSAVAATADAARAIGMVVKDHQVNQAVSDAVTVWKQFGG
jgi:hypothetical protein